MDVDGILTDGTIGTSSDGREIKFFSVLDGLGLKRVLESGLEVAWISGRRSGATIRRARELRIPRVIQGRTDKLAALSELAAELGISREECLYLGDDDIDAPALRWASVGITVPTAMPAARLAADWITNREAGRGAVRQVCDLLLAARGADRFLPRENDAPECHRRSPIALRICALGAAWLFRAAAADSGLAPAKNWVLPLFTKEGYHSMTLRGAEVHPVSSVRIDVTDLNITVFSGDDAAQVETVLLSPHASYFPREKRASGPGSVRVIRFGDGKLRRSRARTGPMSRRGKSFHPPPCPRSLLRTIERHGLMK